MPGYLVVRYDKRGVGQSGGRVEHAGLAEYADDVVADRDVAAGSARTSIPNRIAVLTHGEGSAVGLIAAGKEKKIRALGLLAAPGLTGREVVLEQQQQALARRNEPEADRQAKIALQRRVIDVVTTGKGWETLPPDVRRQADSPWFKSWLLFDPAVAMKKVSTADADPARRGRSADAAVARRSAGAVAAPAERARRRRIRSKVVVPGVNHLMVVGPGDPESFDSTASRGNRAGGHVAAIVAWLNAR